MRVIALLLLAQLAAASEPDVSGWCSDRIVGEHPERGRWAITYIWESQDQPCAPLDACAITDMTGDGMTGIPDFQLLVQCIGTEVYDYLPPVSP